MRRRQLIDLAFRGWSAIDIAGEVIASASATSSAIVRAQHEPQRFDGGISACRRQIERHRARQRSATSASTSARPPEQIGR
jgi:hypothetical protein